MESEGTATTQVKPNLVEITLDANGEIVLSGGEEPAGSGANFSSKANRGQGVSWSCDPAFTVTFSADTPLDKKTVVGQHGASGGHVRGNALSGRYKYSVSVVRPDGTTKVIDPELIIR